MPEPILQQLGQAARALDKQAGPSQYLTALTRTPLVWDSQQPLLQNVLNHLGGVYRHGSELVGRQYETDRMFQNLNPQLQYQRLTQALSGQDPVVDNPLDRVLYHGPRWLYR